MSPPLTRVMHHAHRIPLEHKWDDDLLSSFDLSCFLLIHWIFNTSVHIKLFTDTCMCLVLSLQVVFCVCWIKAVCRMCKPQSHHIVDHFAKLFSQQPLCSQSMLMIVYLYSLLTSFRCSANWAGTQCERPAPKSSRSDNMSGGEDWECQEALKFPVWIPACVTGSLTLLHFSGAITRTSEHQQIGIKLPNSYQPLWFASFEQKGLCSAGFPCLN